VFDLLDEIQVDLDGRERQLLEHGEGTEAGAEIIQGQVEARLAQSKQMAQARLVVGHRGLREIEGQGTRG